VTENGHSLEERVYAIEAKLYVIEATKGTLKLCPSHVKLLWSVMLGLVAAIAFVLHTEWVTSQNTQALINLSAKVETHIAAPGHAISLERLLQMQQTLNEVKALVLAHMERASR
jgi:hypothetical protein